MKLRLMMALAGLATTSLSNFGNAVVIQSSPQVENMLPAEELPATLTQADTCSEAEKNGKNTMDRAVGKFGGSKLLQTVAGMMQQPKPPCTSQSGSGCGCASQPPSPAPVVLPWWAPTAIHPHGNIPPAGVWPPPADMSINPFPVTPPTPRLPPRVEHYQGLHYHHYPTRDAPKQPCPANHCCLPPPPPGYPSPYPCSQLAQLFSELKQVKNNSPSSEEEADLQ